MGDSASIDLIDFLSLFATDNGEINTDYAAEIHATTADSCVSPIFPPMASPSRQDDRSSIPGPGSVNNLSITDYSTPNVNLDSNTSQQQTRHTSDLSVGSEGHSSYTQESCKSKISRSKPCACLITGCTQRFNRTDSRISHLRRKHRLRIPRGCWAKTWISKPENRHHYSAAVAEQARANSILSPEMEN